MSPVASEPAGARRQGVWSRYWRSLPPQAGSGSFAGGYEGQAIGRWWAGELATAPTTAHWLDLATGNGAVPRLWAGSPASTGRMTAVDLAHLHLPWVDALPESVKSRIDWRGGVDVEALPFGDGCFDVVSSQFGVEYAHLPRVADESLRVLKPQGRLRWVLHDAQGRPAALARAEVEHIDWLCGAGGLWQTTLQMIEPMSRLSDPGAAAVVSVDRTALAARRLHDAALAQVQAQGEHSSCPDVLFEAQDAASRILACAVHEGAAAAGALAQRWKHHLEDSRFRLAELLAHALDAQALQALAGRLEQRGCRISVGSLVDQGWPMAHWLMADRVPE